MSDDRTRPTTENDTVILFARDSGEVVVVPEEAHTSAGAGTTSAESGAVDAPTEEAATVSGSEETTILDADEPASETEVLEQAEDAVTPTVTEEPATEQLDTHGPGDGATGSAASASTAPSAAVPPPPAAPAWNTPGYVTFEEEAPRRGVRVGQLLWGGLVMVLGIFLIAFGLLPDIDVPLTLIGLLGLLGVGFVVGAIASGLAGRSKRRRR